MTDCKFANYTGSATTTPESDTSIKTVVMTPVIPDVNLDKVIAQLHKGANELVTEGHKYGKGMCAHYVGLALKAGGGTLNGNPNPNEKNRPEAAKNWGCLLKRNGFKELTTKADPTFAPKKGDTVVIQDYSGDPNTYGHIAIYDGDHWVSDFKQETKLTIEDSFYPGNGYRKATPRPAYVIYRKPEWQ